MEGNYPAEHNSNLSAVAQEHDTTNETINSPSVDQSPSQDKILTESDTGDINNNVVTSHSLSLSHSADDVLQHCSTSDNHRGQRQGRKSRKFSTGRQLPNRCRNSLSLLKQEPVRASKSCTKQCEILRSNYETRVAGGVDDFFCSLYQDDLNNERLSDASEDYGPILFDDEIEEDDIEFYRCPHGKNFTLEDEEMNDDDASSKEGEDVECDLARENLKETMSSTLLTDTVESTPETADQVDMPTMSVGVETEVKPFLKISPQAEKIEQTSTGAEEKAKGNYVKDAGVSGTECTSDEVVIFTPCKYNVSQEVSDRDANGVEESKRSPLPPAIKEAIMRAVANGDFDDASSVKVDENGYLLHDSRDCEKESPTANTRSDEIKDRTCGCLPIISKDTQPSCPKISDSVLEKEKSAPNNETVPCKLIEHNDIFYSGKRIDVLVSNQTSANNSPRSTSDSGEKVNETINASLGTSKAGPIVNAENDEFLSRTTLDNYNSDQTGQVEVCCSVDKELLNTVCSKDIEKDFPKQENTHNTKELAEAFETNRDGLKTTKHKGVTIENTKSPKEIEFKNKFISFEWPNEVMNRKIIGNASALNEKENIDEYRNALGNNSLATEREMSNPSQITSALPKIASPDGMINKRKTRKGKGKSTKGKRKEIEQTKPESKFLSLLLNMIDDDGDDKAEGKKGYERHSVRFDDDPHPPDIDKKHNRTENGVPKFPRGLDQIRPTADKKGDTLWSEIMSSQTRRNIPRNRPPVRSKKRSKSRRIDSDSSARGRGKDRTPEQGCSDHSISPSPRPLDIDNYNKMSSDSCLAIQSSGGVPEVTKILPRESMLCSPCENAPRLSDEGSVRSLCTSANAEHDSISDAGGYEDQEDCDMSYLELAPFSKNGEDRYSLLKDYYSRKSSVTELSFPQDHRLGNIEGNQTLPNIKQNKIGIRISKVSAHVPSIMDAYRVKDVTQHRIEKPGYGIWNYPKVDGYKSETNNQWEVENNNKQRCAQLNSGDTVFKDNISTPLDAGRKRLIYTNLLQMNARRELHTTSKTYSLSNACSTSNLSKDAKDYPKPQNKVRFGGVSLKRFRQNDDPWNSTVNEMLSKSNKAMEENKMNAKDHENRFPRPDSAQVVDAVPKKPFTFLSELLEQDIQDKLECDDTQTSSLSSDRNPSNLTLEIKPERILENMEKLNVSNFRTCVPSNECSTENLPGIEEKTLPLVNQPPTSMEVLRLHTNPSERARQKLRYINRGFSHFELKTDAMRSVVCGSSTQPSAQKSPRPFDRHSTRNFQNDKAYSAPRDQLRGARGGGGRESVPQRQGYRQGVQRATPNTISHRRPSKTGNRASMNYLLNQHSDVFNYYNSPLLRDRERAIVQMYDD